MSSLLSDDSARVRRKAAAYVGFRLVVTIPTTASKVDFLKSMINRRWWLSESISNYGQIEVDGILDLSLDAT